MKRLLLLAATGALLTSASAWAAGTDVAQNPGKRGLVPPPPPAIPIVMPRTRASTTVTPAASAANDPNKIIVGTGGPFTLTGRGAETFAGTFTWKPDTPNQPLTLQVTNAPQLVKWIRVSLGNRVLATEKDFRSGGTLTLELGGTVDNGLNQITIQAGGARGAQVGWTLTSVTSAKMLSLEPDEVLQGDKVTIKGQGFPTDASKLLVQIGKKSVPVKTATPTELKIDVPKNMDIDEHTVTVWQAGKKLPGSAKLIVRGIPRLTSTNLNGCPPGYPIVIFGKNFSKKLAENRIMVGDVQAQVQSGSTTELTVICPSEGGNLYAPHGPMDLQTYLQIKLKVGKIECKDSLPLAVGNSVWQDPGFRGGSDVPEVPVDIRNNMIGE